MILPEVILPQEFVGIHNHYAAAKTLQRMAEKMPSVHSSTYREWKQYILDATKALLDDAFSRGYQASEIDYDRLRKDDLV